MLTIKDLCIDCITQAELCKDTLSVNSFLCNQWFWMRSEDPFGCRERIRSLQPPQEIISAPSAQSGGDNRCSRGAQAGFYSDHERVSPPANVLNRPTGSLEVIL